MKKVKNIICAVLAVLVVFGFAACKRNVVPAPTATPAPTTSSAPTVSPAPDAADGAVGTENASNYSEEEHIEFLRNRLSNYFDTPTTDYVKYGEEYDDGELHFIYRAMDKNTSEVLGIYRFPADLHELEKQEPDGDFEEIWDKEMFDD